MCEPTIQSTSLVAPRCILYVHITESYACACTCTVFCNILLVCRFLDAAELPEAPAERDVSHSSKRSHEFDVSKQRAYTTTSDRDAAINLPSLAGCAKTIHLNVNSNIHANHTDSPECGAFVAL